MPAVLRLAPDRRWDIAPGAGGDAPPRNIDRPSSSAAASRAADAVSEAAQVLLFQRLVAGEPLARAELDALVEDRLVALAERTLEGRGDARTIVREATERVLRDKLPTLRQQSLGVLCAYLRTMVHMRARQISMRERRRRELLDDHREAPALRLTAAGCGFSTPEARLIEKEQLARMHGCMSKLPQNHQRLVEMRCYEASTWQEITEEMNQRFPRAKGKLAGKARSEKTVKRTFESVLEALRSCMEGV